jgi:hypothetical protein
LLKIGLRKVQRQDKVPIVYYHFRIGEISAEIVREQVYLREQSLLLEAVDQVAQNLPRGFRIARNAQLSNKAWFGQRSSVQSRGGRVHDQGPEPGHIDGRAEEVCFGGAIGR